MVVSGEFGGAAGVRDRAALESALSRPAATFAGELLYGNPFARAAALMESILRERPFASANQATALMATALWLEREGYRLDAEGPELVHITLAAAAGAIDVDHVAEWLRSHAARLDG